MSHTIRISKSLYKELLFHGDDMERIDVESNVNLIAADIIISVLCTLNFPHDLSDRFIELIDQAEERLNHQFDTLDRSKTVKISDDIYKALSSIKGDASESDMACTVLKKGLAIMEMDLTELSKLKCIYDDGLTKTRQRVVYAS